LDLARITAMSKVGPLGLAPGEAFAAAQSCGTLIVVHW
jgi:hypothetical protein